MKDFLNKKLKIISPKYSSINISKYFKIFIIVFLFVNVFLASYKADATIDFDVRKVLEYYKKNPRSIPTSLGNNFIPDTLLERLNSNDIIMDSTGVYSNQDNYKNTNPEEKRLIKIIFDDTINKNGIKLQSVMNEEIGFKISIYDYLKASSTLSSKTKELLNKIIQVFSNSSKIATPDTYNSLKTTTLAAEDRSNRFEEDGNMFFHDYKYIDIDGNSSISTIIKIQWRVYVYNELSKLKTTYSDADKTVLDTLGSTLNLIAAAGGHDAGRSLENGEINNYSAIVKGTTFPINLVAVDPKNPTEVRDIELGSDGSASGNALANKCGGKPDLWDLLSKSECSLTAFLINSILKGLNHIAGMILGWIISILEWTISFGITNFYSLVTNSTAYEISRDVFLALVFSLLIPLTFYLILKMLITNENDTIKKVLPKILFVALFAAFAFPISGMLIDLSNVTSLKIYNTLSGEGDTQSFSRKIKTSLLGDNTYSPTISEADWATVPAFAMQLVITFLAIAIFFEAAILIFSRAITLLLCLIFSPIMILPSGIYSKIDDYKKKITDNFINSLLLAPIFFFMIFVALKIMDAGQTLIEGSGAIPAVQGSDSFMPMSVILRAVLGIVMMKLALKTAKDLTGDIGGAVSSKIQKYTGKLGGATLGAAGGLTAMGLRKGASKIADSKGMQKWIAKGGKTGKYAAMLSNKLNNSTFDVRNTKLGKVADNYMFKGQEGSTMLAKNYKTTAESVALNKENKEKKNQALNNQIKEAQKANAVGFEEKLKKDPSFDKSIEASIRITDEGKRMDSTMANLDKHFEKNGQAPNYFSSEMAKPENADFSRKLSVALKNTDPEKRKEAVSQVVNNFENKDEYRAKEAEKNKRLDELKEKRDGKREQMSNYMKEIDTDKEKGQKLGKEIAIEKENKKKEIEGINKINENIIASNENISKVATSVNSLVDILKNNSNNKSNSYTMQSTSNNYTVSSSTSNPFVKNGTEASPQSKDPTKKLKV